MTAGFGLLEVLAALGLLAVSLLALSNGLIVARQYSAQTLAFSHTGIQAENMYEHLLANPVGKQQGAYYQQTVRLPSCWVCSPYEQATRDLAQWQQQLRVILPQSTQRIQPMLAGQQITISWPQTADNPHQQAAEWKVYVSG